MVRERKKKSAKEVKLHLNPTGDPQVGFEAAKFDIRHAWPLKSDSVDELFSHYGFQRIPGNLRPRVMEELYRVLKPGAKATIVTPYYSSMRSIMDYSYEWPPVCEMSYLYFNKSWRQANQITDIKCDFDFTYGYSAEGDTQTKAQDVQVFWIKHYANAVLDLQVVLTKRDAIKS